jgi:hypothetical protein
MADVDDRRADIAAALESAPIADAPATDTSPGQDNSGKIAVTSAPIASESEPTTIGSGDDRKRGEDGKFIKSSEPKVTPDPAKLPEVAKPIPDTAVQPVVAKKKPPAGWRPLAKEKWDGLPPEVQDEAIRRDREINMALQDASEARQFHQKWREMAGPYEPMFRGQGSDSVQAAQYLFQQYAALATSPPQTRAQTLATWINQFLPGEEGIQLLSNVLAGSAGQQAPQQSQPQYRDPRVDEIYNTITQAKQYQARMIEQQAAQAVSEVEQEEFFDDVRPIMADMIEVAARNGLTLSPKDAYTRAVLVHPETKKVLEQRQAAQSANASTARSAQAAVSVRSNPASGDGVTQSGPSMRDDIAAAWNASKRG